MSNETPSPEAVYREALELLQKWHDRYGNGDCVGRNGQEWMRGGMVADATADFLARALAAPVPRQPDRVALAAAMGASTDVRLAAPAAQPADPVERDEALGPDSFGGSDFPDVSGPPVATNRVSIPSAPAPSPAPGGALFSCGVDLAAEDSERTVLTIAGRNEADLIAGARAFLANRAAASGGARRPAREVAHEILLRVGMCGAGKQADGRVHSHSPDCHRAMRSIEAFRDVAIEADRAAQPAPRCDCGDECSGRCAEARAAQPSDTAAPTGEARGVYIASRVKHAFRWKAARASGVPIISTWIDEAGEGDTADLGELWARIQREVSGAERLVFYVEPDDFPFKGALVEVGMALAAGVSVFLVLSPDVVLEERSLRPLGSWAKHPGVRWSTTLYDAFNAPVATRSTPAPVPRDEVVAEVARWMELTTTRWQDQPAKLRDHSWLADLERLGGGKETA